MPLKQKFKIYKPQSNLYHNVLNGASSIQVDAITYYTDEESRLAEKCELEKVNAFRDVLGMCFITFEDDHVAARYVV